MGDSTVMTIETFKFYTVQQLKDYVSDRGMTKSGTKEELVARAFVAYELDLPVKQTELQLKETLKKDYARLLYVSEGRVLPDPLTISKDEWIGEKNGLKKWPSIFISDISDFYKLKNSDDCINLTKRMLNEYKEGKAYRYFTDGWLKEVFIIQCNFSKRVSTIHLIFSKLVFCNKGWEF